jgi:hypothetical protein
MEGRDIMNDSRIISYLTLRKAVGIIGFLLPIGLVIGNVYVFQDPAIRPSISDYYHTHMRDWLVGNLFAIGVFLFSYRGYDASTGPRLQRLFGRSTDYFASSLAGVGAIGVALFPTQKKSATIEQLIGNKLHAGVHVLSAGLFFILVAYILIWRFTDHGPPKDEPGATAEKSRKRCNRIYRVCGWAILFFIALIVVVWALQDDYPIITQAYPVLVLETLAIWAFSMSWFLKGSVHLKRVVGLGWRAGSVYLIRAAWGLRN